eukprot:TRINITY_DN3105_c0_g1_i3.p1 TRINITY_DN3105_c0_g1~~TRINITY_DN3105_c0_g1_i3.p1  ORF type:complete len:501 (+),score=99.84 TRINITY_DN3105_c0_g1_i3:119-1621(+)
MPRRRRASTPSSSAQKPPISPKVSGYRAAQRNQKQHYSTAPMLGWKGPPPLGRQQTPAPVVAREDDTGAAAAATRAAPDSDAGATMHVGSSTGSYTTIPRGGELGNTALSIPMSDGHDTSSPEDTFTTAATVQPGAATQRPRMRDPPAPVPAAPLQQRCESPLGPPFHHTSKRFRETFGIQEMDDFNRYRVDYRRFRLGHARGARGEVNQFYDQGGPSVVAYEHERRYPGHAVWTPWLRADDPAQFSAARTGRHLLRHRGEQPRLDDVEGQHLDPCSVRVRWQPGSTWCIDGHWEYSQCFPAADAAPKQHGALDSILRKIKRPVPAAVQDRADRQRQWRPFPQASDRVRRRRWRREVELVGASPSVSPCPSGSPSRRGRPSQGPRKGPAKEDAALTIRPAGGADGYHQFLALHRSLAPEKQSLPPHSPTEVVSHDASPVSPTGADDVSAWTMCDIALTESTRVLADEVRGTGGAARAAGAEAEPERDQPVAEAGPAAEEG